MDEQKQNTSDLQVSMARARLTGRLADLERRSVGVVTDAVGTVETVTSSVKSAAHETVDAAKQICREAGTALAHALDISKKVQENPWEHVGAAAALGFFIGFLPGANHGSGSNSNGSSSRMTSSFDAPSIFGDLFKAINRELQSVGEAAIASGAAKLRQTLSGEVGNGH